MQKDENKNYITSDLGQAAAIISAGFELKDVDKTNRLKVVYIFDFCLGIIETSEKYWADNLLISARRYFENLKMLKSRIYGN
jgi:hypothetical protein